MASLAASRLLESLLYGVQPGDTATFAAKVKGWIVNAMFRRKGEAIRQTVIEQNPA